VGSVVGSIGLVESKLSIKNIDNSSSSFCLVLMVFLVPISKLRCCFLNIIVVGWLLGLWMRSPIVGRLLLERWVS
jgi:hypothetical protein